MAWFSWKGNYNGKHCSGITKSLNPEYLVNQLGKLDIELVSYSAIAHKLKLGASSRQRFYKDLSLLLKSGLPLLNSLKILVSRSRNKKELIILTALMTDLEFGLQEISLKDVIPEEEYVFWKIGLDSNFSDFLEQLISVNNLKFNFRSNVLKLLVMPCLSILGLIMVVAFMVLFVVPEISELTGVTPRFVEFINNLKSLTGLFYIICVFGLVVGFLQQLLKLIKIWLFPELQILAGLRLFEALLKAGFSSSEAFYVLKSFKEHAYWQRLFSFQEQGFSLVESLYRANWHRIVPELVSLVQLSEYHGNLKGAISSAVIFYDNKIIKKLTLVVGFVQPLAFLLIALSLVFVLAEIYFPMLDLSNYSI